MVSVTVAAATPAFLPANAERGQRLAASCLACHAAPNLPLGDPAVHSPKLFGQRPDALFLALLSYQRAQRDSPIMRAAVASLTLQDLRDLGAYLAAEGPVRPPQPAGVGGWAHERVHRECTACHGETGMGEMWGIPVIAGQHRDYLIAALNAYRSGERRDATMSPIAARLSDSEIEGLAEYFSSQSHLRVDR